MKGTLSSCIITTLLLLTAQLGNSQKVWSLEDCINHAMDKSISVEMAKLNQENSALTHFGAKQSRYPNLNGNVNLASNFGRTIDPTTNDFITRAFVSNNYGLSTGVMLYNAGRINNTIRQAEKSMEQTAYNTLSVKYDIALQVSNQYMNVLFAEENLTNSQTQLELVSSQKENLEKLINAGVRPSNDIFELEAQLAQSKQSILEAENRLALAKLGLAQLLRLDDNTIEIEKGGELGAILDPNTITYEELITKTISHHPGLRAAQLAVEQAQIGEDIAKAALYPSVSVGANLGTAYSGSGMELSGFESQLVSQTVIFNGTPATFEIEQDVPVFIDSPYANQISDNLSYGIGLGVSVPIFNNSTAKIGIERAKLNTKNQQLSLDQTKESIRLDLQNVLLDAQGAKARYEASTLTLKSQEAAFEFTDKKFKAGSIGNLEWVTAQNIYQQTAINNIIAKFEYYFTVKVLEFYMNGIN